MAPVCFAFKGIAVVTLKDCSQTYLKGFMLPRKNIKILEPSEGIIISVNACISYN